MAWLMGIAGVSIAAIKPAAGAENMTPQQIEAEKKAAVELKALQDNAQIKANTDVTKNLESFGFAPALFIVDYHKKIISDSKDVKTRGDGTIVAGGSKYSVNFGVELHYDFAFGVNTKCFEYSSSCTKKEDYNQYAAHRISPFVGLFDLQNGINGMSIGVLYGYTRGKIEDQKLVNKTTLNFGIGWAVHKNQLVLADDVAEGKAPPSGLTVQDYTKREDVQGFVVMLSVNYGF